MAKVHNNKDIKHPLLFLLVFCSLLVISLTKNPIKITMKQTGKKATDLLSATMIPVYSTTALPWTGLLAANTNVICA